MHFKYFEYAFGYSKWTGDELWIKIILLFKSAFITCNIINCFYWPFSNLLLCEQLPRSDNSGKNNARDLFRKLYNLFLI